MESGDLTPRPTQASSFPRAQPVAGGGRPAPGRLYRRSDLGRGRRRTRRVESSRSPAGPRAGPPLPDSSVTGDYANQSPPRAKQRIASWAGEHRPIGWRAQAPDVRWRPIAHTVNLYRSARTTNFRDGLPPVDRARGSGGLRALAAPGQPTPAFAARARRAAGSGTVFCIRVRVRSGRDGGQFVGR